jgi:hypothetical protein
MNTYKISNFLNLTLGTLALSAAILVISLFFGGTTNVNASAPSGLPATVATSSAALVNTTASMLFATSTAGQCSARIVTTYASPIMLTFSDYIGQSPTGQFGHLQGASTTVAYDSGLYGCGLVKAYSFVSQTITISESR